MAAPKGDKGEVGVPDGRQPVENAVPGRDGYYKNGPADA